MFAQMFSLLGSIWERANGGAPVHLMILKDNNEGMRCLFIYFFKEKKKCICGAFQLDAAVPRNICILFSLILLVFIW